MLVAKTQANVIRCIPVCLLSARSRCLITSGHICNQIFFGPELVQARLEMMSKRLCFSDIIEDQIRIFAVNMTTSEGQNNVTEAGRLVL